MHRAQSTQWHYIQKQDGGLQFKYMQMRNGYVDMPEYELPVYQLSSKNEC